MAVSEIESRVAILEAKVEQLQQQMQAVATGVEPWWERIVGAFADDPAFEEAMRLGRKYRESLRPKRRARSTKHAQSARARKR